MIRETVRNEKFIFSFLSVKNKFYLKFIFFGIYKSYHSNGQLSEEVNYIDDKRNG